MSERKIECWDEPDREDLRFSDRDEAIEAILDAMDDPLPEKITICGYARMEVDLSSSDILTDFLERLDEDYGNPDGDLSEPTEAMKEAEKAFLAVIQREYEPWMCEEVCREEVNVSQWIDATRDRGSPATDRPSESGSRGT